MNYDLKSIKKGKDTRAHQPPRLLLKLKRRLDSTPDSRQGFAYASTTKPEPLQVENYKKSVVYMNSISREVFIGVTGAITELMKSITCQVLAGRPWSVASIDSRPRGSLLPPLGERHRQGN
jgi:hypothetical protein